MKVKSNRTLPKGCRYKTPYANLMELKQDRLKLSRPDVNLLAYGKLIH